MIGSHGDRRPADAAWTNQRDEPSLPNPPMNLGHRRLATDQHQGSRSEPPSKIAAIAPTVLAIIRSDDRADERVALSLDGCDVAIAMLAVTKCLADRGYVDSEAPFLNDYVRPDVTDELLARNELTWALGKINQDGESPAAKGHQYTLAPQRPFANRKFERAEVQLSISSRARHGFKTQHGIRA
jgi:hypothetical protein